MADMPTSPGEDRDTIFRLRSFVDTLDVPLPDTLDDALDERGRSAGDGPADELSRRRVSRRALLGGVAAAAGIVGVTVVAGGRSGRSVLSPGGGAAAPIPRTLTTTLPGYWPLRPPLEFLPNGPVSMTYTQGVKDFLDEPSRQVTLDDGFGGMRALATSNDRENYTSPAPAIVSYDGTMIAVGSISWQGEVVLVDAGSGDTRTVRVTDRPQRDVVPLEFAPDGRHVYVRDQDATHTPQRDYPPYGRVVRVDLASGQSTDAGFGDDVVGLSCAPDSGRFAIIRRGGRVEILHRNGRRAATLGKARPARTGFYTSLPEHAWSPDGARIIAFDSAREPVLLVFDLGGHVTRWPMPRAVRDGLGWTGPGTYLVLGSPEDRHGTGEWSQSLGEVDVRTGVLSRVATWSRGPIFAHVSGVSIAQGLALGWSVTRQPW